MTFLDFGIRLPAGARGNQKAYCPKCSDQRRNKGDKPLSVDVEKGVWNCHHCGWAGGLKEHKEFMEPEKKQYSRPTLPAELKISEGLAQYLTKERGFSTYTIQRFKLGEEAVFMPQKGEKVKCVIFPYFRDEEAINVKYRSRDKNFMLAKDCELIFYHLDSIQGQTTCIITEGEFDAMAAYEAGFHSVVSVPNGASKGNQKLQYVDNCYDQFEHVTEIIIATDGDGPGLALRDELARRFGRHRCKYVTYPDGIKDLNDLLRRYVTDPKHPLPDELARGKQDIKTVIATAKEFPIEGFYSVSDIEPELDAYYQNGFESGDHVGYPEFDTLFSFRRGELTTVTGIPGSGKSAFLDQLLVRLSSRHGWRHAVCSFENQPTALHISKLAACFIGRPFFRADPNAKMSTTEWATAKRFVQEGFRFFKLSEVDLTIDVILDRCKELVHRLGVDSLVIDPWNCVEHNIPIGLSETQFVSKSLQQIKNFATIHRVHVFLVAHPTKIQKDKVTKKYETPTLYQISGSAHFFNKTDNGIVVYRDFDTNLITVFIQKVRFFFVGRIGSADFTYDVATGRYAEPGQGHVSEISSFNKRHQAIQESLCFTTDEPMEEAPF